MLTRCIGEEIELRLPRRRDAPAHVELLARNRVHLGKWLCWARNERTIDQERAAIHSLRLAYANEESLTFAIWYRGCFAGFTGLYAIDQQSLTASLGYWLGEEFVGKGIVSRASASVLQHAFDVLKLVRIEADPHEGNHASMATLERLGFVKERIHLRAAPLYGQWLDVHLYALLAKEWLGPPGL